MEVSRLRLLFLIALAATTLPGCALFRRGDVSLPPAASEQTAAEPVTGEPVRQADHRPAGRAPRDPPHPHRHRGLRGRRVRRHAQHRRLREQRRVWRAPRLSPHRRLLSRRDRRAVACGPHQLRESVGLCGPADGQRARLHVLRIVGWDGTRCRAKSSSGKIAPTTPRSTWWPASAAPTFAGDDRFTVSGGFGYRILPADWIAVHFDVRDHVYDIDLLGEKKIVNNLEAHLGLSIFF